MNSRRARTEPGTIVHWRYNSISTITMSEPCLIVNASYNRTFHAFEAEAVYGQIVAGFCVLGRIQEQPLFSLVSARATSGSLCRPVPDCPPPVLGTGWSGKGPFALTTRREYGCRVYPPHSSMPSSSLLQKYAACKSVAVSLKQDLALRSLRFQKQLQTLGVCIFQYRLESLWLSEPLSIQAMKQGQAVVQQFWNLDWIRKCPCLEASFQNAARISFG